MQPKLRSLLPLIVVASLVLCACAPVSYRVKITININGGTTAAGGAEASAGTTTESASAETGKEAQAETSATEKEPAASESESKATEAVSEKPKEETGTATKTEAKPEEAKPEEAKPEEAKPVETGTTVAESAYPGVLTGTVAYLQRIALPENAVVEVWLLDASKGDDPAAVIVSQTIPTAGAQVPISFELAYDPAQIDAKNQYLLKAAISVDGKQMWASTQAYPVLTNDNPVTGVEILVEQVPQEAEATQAPEAAPEANVVDTLAADPRFSTLVSLVKAAGLVRTLRGAGPFTVFAPTNDAFAKLPKAVLDLLMKDRKLLKNILLNHVATGKAMAADVANMTGAPTALPGGAVVIKAGEDGVTVDGSKVVETDIAATNGVIHAIDSVILTPMPLTKRLAAEGNYTTLLKALKAARMITALDQSSHEFTLLAPTDEAFAKLPPDTLAGVLKDRKQLTAILRNHIASGKLMASDVAKQTALETVDGGKLPVMVDANIVMIDDARVIAADIVVLNGVVHSVDTVILPKPASAGRDAGPQIVDGGRM